MLMMTPFRNSDCVSSAVLRSAVFRSTFNPRQQLSHELPREYPPIRLFPKTWIRLHLALLQASWVSYHSSSDPFTLLSHNPLLRRGAAHRASFHPLAPSPVPCRDSVVGTQVSFAKVSPPSPSCLRKFRNSIYKISNICSRLLIVFELLIIHGMKDIIFHIFYLHSLICVKIQQIEKLLSKELAQEATQIL